MNSNPTQLLRGLRMMVAGLCLSVLPGAGSLVLAQGVGINTTTPDPSAALHIQSSNSGLLLPQVNLQSVTDKTTIPAPAPGLLIYNTNPALDGAGFYYNNGTKTLPNWTNLNQFKIPYYVAAEHNGAAFQIDNYNGALGSAAIKGYSSGKGIGVLAESDPSGYALVVNGDVKLSGGNLNPAAGKVLTSVGSDGYATWQDPKVAPKVAFKASGVKGGGSEKTASGNFDTKIPFASEEYDLGNNYNDVNSNPHSTFIAPVNGIYHFDVKLLSNMPDGTGNDGEHYVGLKLNKDVNGSISLVAAESSFGTQTLFFNNLSVDVKLNQGERIFVVVTNLNGDYIYLHTEPYNTYFSGHLVTPL
ncbi:C1q-like domain-containing protein [Dyadobacter sandarakinus]|uniref:C1q domain-containing protein n=1 Tax=Dyadobacter sandarakinus TaxID=2747268 RepID=A0ABX7I8M7_9BACT|nr:hypothetical protein [Dyadobacter sandarakinus]QRR02454.1 hypothetical protein HWI92_16810 [Dyadobacter sandarakinus]